MKKRGTEATAPFGFVNLSLLCVLFVVCLLCLSSRFYAIVQYSLVLDVLILGIAVYCQVGSMYWQTIPVDNVDKRCVFVTGCDSGFGCGLAKRLEQLGVTVFAGCLTNAGKEQYEYSSLIHPIELDVTSTQSVEASAETVKKLLKEKCQNRKLWGVVNNAGVMGDFGTTEMHTVKTANEVMEVNFYGQLRVIESFLPLLKESKGRLINMASVVGVNAHACLGFPTPYAASKHAVVGYTEGIRRDLAKWGVHVSLILPGGHSTTITAGEGQLNRFNAMWGRLSEVTRKEFGSQWIEKVCENFQSLKPEKLPGVDPVILAYTSALFSSVPRPRYLVGADAHLFSILSHCPYWLTDMMYDKPLNFMDIPTPAALVPSR